MVCWSGRELRNTTPNFLIMTTINTDYSNNEYGNEFTADKLTELSEDDLEGVAGGTGIDWIDPKTHTPWFL